MYQKNDKTFTVRIALFFLISRHQYYRLAEFPLLPDGSKSHHNPNNSDSLGTTETMEPVTGQAIHSLYCVVGSTWKPRQRANQCED